MPPTELNWTFDSIPIEGEDEAQRLRGLAPAPQPPTRRRGRRRGWLLAGGLGLALALGLSAYLVYLNGWRRVEAQVAGEVAYEDDQSLARNTDTVAALQWPNPAWVQARTAEAAHGWPARPPADDLFPVAEPGEVIAVETLAANEVAVTVLRSVADSAGRTFAFEYVQHYRNTGPGQWRRQAPAGLEAETVWAGRRLTVTLPLADEPWLKTILPLLDANLIRACAEWQCPNDLVVPVSFTGRLEDVPFLPAPRRGEPPASGQAYPVTFDLIFRNPRFPRRLILPSLHLAGRPHDAAAQAALVRSTTVSLLAYIATEIAQTSRSSRGDYLDALIARAEIRLGLSPTPAWAPRPGNYLPPDSLWPQSSIGESPSRRPPIAARLQALAFLDYALGRSLASADAGLLRQLRFQNRLDEWLSNGLRTDGAALVARWQAEVAARFAATVPPRWAELEGLAYLCQDGAWLVRGGRPVALPVDGPSLWLPREALSPNGQYLAVVEASTSPVARLRVFDLFAGTSSVVAAEGLGLPLGWSADGALLYLSQGDGPFSPVYAYELRLYDPATGQVVALGAEPLVTPWGHDQSWSADRTLLAVTLVQSAGPARGEIAVSPGLIALRAPLQVLRLPVAGYGAALSPDGQRLAYVTGTDAKPIAPGQPPGGPHRIDLINLTTQAVYGVVVPGTAGQPGLHDLHALMWSPDGRRLAFMDYAPDSGVRLHTLTFNSADPAAGADLGQPLGPLPQMSLAGFSADSRYLAAQLYDQVRSELVVYDLETGATQRYLGGEVARPWSPDGHRLALAGPAGVYVVDAATGEEQWVGGGACEVGWFRLP